MQTPLTGQRVRAFAGVAGGVLCILAVAFLARRAVSLHAQLGERISAIAPGRAGAAVAIYMVGGLLLGLAWVGLVRLCSGRVSHTTLLFRAHLQSQLAKYVPGNVFHFAYRHLAAHRAGISHGPLALALGLESMILIAAASMFALALVSDPSIEAVAPWAIHLVWLAPAIPVLAWFALGAVARRRKALHLELRRSAPQFAAILALDLVFFLLASCAIRLLAHAPDLLAFGGWCSWLALAWLLGYVVPGAPGGLGLREVVLVHGLGPALGEAEAMVVAIGYRLVTLAADALLAGIGFLFAMTDRSR